MVHPNSKIRKKFRDLLLNKTDAEDRVFTNRKTVIDGMVLPCIVVSSFSGEGIVTGNCGGQLYDRSNSVFIQLYCDGLFDSEIDSVDDNLDALQCQVEEIISDNEFCLDGVCNGYVAYKGYHDTSFQRVSQEHNSLEEISCRAIEYSAPFQTDGLTFKFDYDSVDCSGIDVSLPGYGSTQKIELVEG